MTWSGEITPTGTMLSALAITVSRGHRDHRIEVASGQRVAQIAQVVGKERLHQSEIGAQRHLQQILPFHRPRCAACLSRPGCRCRFASGPRRGRNRRRECARSACLAARVPPPVRRPVICRCVSGLRPIWLTIALRTSLAPMSLPIPRPGMAVSLAMTVRLRFFCRTISSMTLSGVPTAMNPPIIRLAPSGIIATDCSREIVCMVDVPVARPAEVKRGSAPNCAAALSTKGPQRAALLGVSNSCDGCLSRADQPSPGRRKSSHMRPIQVRQPNPTERVSAG